MTPTVPTEVIICEREPADGPFTQLPFALTPRSIVGTKKLRESIDAAAAEVAAGLPALPDTAIVDILLRRTPRTRSGAPLPHTGDTAADITAALLDLDSSYVAVHGPPGTGKTYTAARIIARAGQRSSVAGRCRRAVARGGGEPVPRSDRGRRRSGTGRQEGLPRRRRVAGDRQGRLRRLHRDERGMRNRRHRMGFRQRQPSGRGQPRPARHRRGRPVLPGQHHRGGSGRQEPAAARRPATAAAGQPGHPSRTGRRIGARLAGRRPAHAARRARLLPRPLVPDASRGVRTRVAAVLRGPAALRGKRTAARHLDGQSPGVRVLTVDHDGNSTSSPEEAAAIVAATRR